MTHCSKAGVLALIAAGMAGGTASAAAPFLINISGATLLRNFLVAPASTNDFLDLDGDMAPVPDQLAPAGVGLPAPGSQLWQVQYRGTGSVNGFIELRDYGLNYAVGGDNVEILSSRASEGGFHNRTIYINNGMPTGPANAANPGAAPTRSTSDGSFMVTNSTDPMNSGILIDIAPLDVPISWATQGPDGAPNPTLTPTVPGYGRNPRNSVNKDGMTNAQTNMLPPIAPLNANTAMPDGSTVYDTSIALAPIAATTNFGTGYTQITYTDLQWLSGTGRTKCGENLMFICRDVGSGTRNAFQNSICTDPSWGYGDNIGVFTSSSANDRLGPNFQPGNKGSNSRVEGTMANHRLAIGYAGAERGVNGGWLTNGVFEVLGVQNDVGGGVAFARPTIGNVLNNTVDGYNISGPAVLATIGDPRASSAAFGGDSNGNPTMRNENAAAYVNNATKSIEAFKALPGGDDTIFSPGEYLAANFLLVNAANFIKNPLNPCELLPNPNVNLALQQLTSEISVLADPVYQNFNMNSSGDVPFRTVGQTYTDGVTGNQTFYNVHGGGTLNYGADLDLRNKIAGDFNNDGTRDCNDAGEMMCAFLFRADSVNFPWNTPASAGVAIEVIGDYNGDGNFDKEDMRYWADGLALDPVTRKLNRCDGFMKLDTEFETRTGGAFGTDFFGWACDMPTIKATGKAYQAGDSVADVAGPAGLWTPGFAPIGHDGMIDAFDINYICANFGDWCVRKESVFMDLSCDINGDLLVDQRDVCKVVIQILGTTFGDVNLDNVVDGADLLIVTQNQGNPGGWAEGDMNCDGMVDGRDLRIVQGVPNLCCPWDLNGDGIVNASDLALVLGSWGAPGGFGPADFNFDGIVNASDLAAMLGAWGPCAN